MEGGDQILPCARLFHGTRSTNLWEDEMASEAARVTLIDVAVVNLATTTIELPECQERRGERNSHGEPSQEHGMPIMGRLKCGTVVCSGCSQVRALTSSPDWRGVGEILGLAGTEAVVWRRHFLQCSWKFDQQSVRAHSWSVTWISIGFCSVRQMLKTAEQETLYNHKNGAKMQYGVRAYK